MSFLDDSNTKQALDAYAQLTREFGSPAPSTTTEAGFVSFAPGRVNLIGEHIDYMGGPVVPCALTQGCYTVVQRRASFDSQLPSDLIFIPTANEIGIVHIDLKSLAQELAGQNAQHPDAAKLRAVAVKSHTLKNGDPCNDASWSTYLVGALAEALLNDLSPTNASSDLKNLTFASETVHFVVHGTLAVGAGLSSSAALCCSLIYSLAYAFNTLSASSMQDKVKLASRARAIEVKYRGVNIGIMDQFISLHGVKGQALVLDCGSLTFQPVETPFEAGTGCRLLMINSMIGHQLGGAYNAIRSDMEKVQALLAESFTAKSPAWKRYVELRAASAQEFTLIRYAQILLAVGKPGVEGPEQEFWDFAKAHSDPAHGEQIDGIDLRFRRAQYVVEEAIRVVRFTDHLEGLAKRIHNGETISPDEQQTNAVRLGTLLSATHHGMASYLKVSTPEVETIHSTALAVPGCYGGRLVGGGFGGCVLLLVADGAVDQVIRQVQDSFAKAFQLKPTVISIAIGAGAQHVAL